MIYGRELPGMPYNLHAKITRGIIWTQRNLFSRLPIKAGIKPLSVNLSRDAANMAIASGIRSSEPFMLGRFGGIELDAISRGVYIRESGNRFVKFCRMLRGDIGPFWWDNSIKAGVCWNAGFFPPDESLLMRYSEQSCRDARQLDVFATYPWANGMNLIAKRFCREVKVCHLSDLNFYEFQHPWTGALKGLKVLVVHPFADTIKAQYDRREELFANHEVLPRFDLRIYRTVSSFAGVKTEYANWFEALEKMESDISRIDFDVALIGCGAYGFSIAAFVKRELGRKAIHMGGVTQILFGIMGRRWSSIPGFADRFYNESWTSPFPSDTVQVAKKTVEGGCYW